MSRHRLIRNLTAEDIDLFDDDFDTELDCYVTELRALVGPTFDQSELEETLLYYDCDLTKSVNWLLDGIDSRDTSSRPNNNSTSDKSSPFLSDSKDPKSVAPIRSRTASDVTKKLITLAQQPNRKSTSPNIGSTEKPSLPYLNNEQEQQHQSLLGQSSILLGLLSSSKTKVQNNIGRNNQSIAFKNLIPVLQKDSNSYKIDTRKSPKPSPSLNGTASMASPNPLPINKSALEIKPCEPVPPIQPGTSFCRVISSHLHFPHQLQSFQKFTLTLFSPYPSCFYPNSPHVSKSLTPFSFSSPSPDDLVLLAHQKSKNTQSKKLKSSHNSKVPPSPAQPMNTPNRTATQSKASTRSRVVIDHIADSVSELGLGELKAVLPPTNISKKRIDVVTEAAKRQQTLNIVIVGHVDAGKSTLTGHLLVQSGEIDKQTIHRYKQESLKQGKGAFAYAWIMDQSAEERNRGVTIDVGVHRITGPSTRVYSLLDAPGHRDFIPNMISGAAQADAAVLVVDAVHGEFEVGLNGGQAREHMLLVKSLGIPRVVVAINKMDCVQWDQNRYIQINEQLISLFSSIGYDCNETVIFVPTSGLSGHNLITRMDSSICNWYINRPCLMEVLETIPNPSRPITKPFRMQVNDFGKGGSASGSVTIWGQIDAGSIQIGDTVLLMPLGEEGIVRALELENEQVKWAIAGDHISVSLSGPDIMQLSTGLVLSSKLQPISITDHFKAKIIVFEPKVPITLGFPVLLFQGGFNETAVISKLHAILDKSDGKVIKPNPRVLTKGATALIELRTDRPICLESYSGESKKYGRFMLRSGGESLAAGIVSQIMTTTVPATMRV